MRRFLICLILPLTLAACGAKSTWAPDEDVQKAAYVSGKEPTVTLYTVIKKRSGEGAHSGLMIDGAQRVMFDPAGTWYHPWVPERNDVHYGITERFRKFYIDYHARETYDVIEQTVPVSIETAELLRARAQAYGAVPKMMCANAVSGVLQDLPEFASVPRTYYPLKIKKAFEKLPTVSERLYHDKDPDNHHGVLLVQVETPVYGPAGDVLAQAASAKQVTE